MPQEIESDATIVFDCKYHVVFCPKYRRKVFVGAIEARLKEIVRSMCAEMDVQMIEMEVMPDHVHLLLAAVDPQFGIHRVVKTIRAGRRGCCVRNSRPSDQTSDADGANSYFVAKTGGAPLAVIKRYSKGRRKSDTAPDLRERLRTPTSEAS